MNAAGRFITLEGGEGAGKSTALAVCRAVLEHHGLDVVQTREPGGAPLAEQIRRIVLDPAQSGMAAETELLLVFAARADHVRRTIRPALARGAWVLCDRFTDSSYAYQGAGRGIAADTIATLESLAVGATRPDLTLLLDLDVATGLARAGGRGAPDRIEAESLAFFERVRAGFRARAATEPGRVALIDAMQPAESVAQALRAALEAFVARSRGRDAR